MDALGCYSSSDDSESKEEDGAEKLNVILAHYSEDDDENEIQKRLPLSTTQKDGHGINKWNEKSKIKKRRKFSDHIETKLPPPQLSNSNNERSADIMCNPFRELISMEKDYLQLLQPSTLHMTRNQTSEGKNDEKREFSLENKLNALYQQFYDNKGGNHNKTLPSFASHLKSQKEFGNPNMFPSVIEHFGINDMGSNLPTAFFDQKKDFKRFEYIERIIAKEEEIRIWEISQRNE